MNELMKSAILEKSQMLDDAEMVKINAQTLRELTAEEVFTFKLAACNNQIDRDFERFTDATLEGFGPMFVGKPVLTDHRWSTGTQTARVYAAEVESKGEVKRLILRCYMPRTERTAEVIAAIESGILRECSVGVAVKRMVCSICGEDNRVTICRHCHGVEYDGKICHFELDGAVDAYEVSLVAVPAQPEAGVVKSKRYGGAEEQPQTAGDPSGDEEMIALAQARIEMEEKRYGGN